MRWDEQGNIGKNEIVGGGVKMEEGEEWENRRDGKGDVV